MDPAKNRGAFNLRCGRALTLLGPAFACALLPVLSLGCSDARGRSEAFAERAAKIDAGTTIAPEDCIPPAPDRVSGQVVLAVETTLAVGKAFLFLGEVRTPEVDGKTAVFVEYQALNAQDRKTLVGEKMSVGPYPLAPDGTLIAPVPEGAIHGDANPALPGLEVTTVMELRGKICGVQKFYCGTITGEIRAPLQGPLTGNFGLTLIPDGQVPERPRYGCAEDALAEPLSP